MAAAPTVHVDPERPLLDERFSVRLSGFPPHRRVTVRARMPLDGHLWASRTVVETDDRGRADLDEQAPLAGTYGRADTMGLVWSAERVGNRPAARTRTQSDGNLSLAATVDGRTVATATVERQFAAEGVAWSRLDAGRDDDHESPLVARFYEPPGEGPYPGILLLGGSSGGFPSRRAASLLASRGYAVLALAYFRAEGLPRQLVEVPLGYVERAVAWLASHESVRAEPLGAVGWSRGGELALLAGSRFDRVRTVVGYAPLPVVFQGNARGDPGSAWTVDGDPHPCVPLSYPPGFRTRTALRWLRGTPVAVRPLFEQGLAAASSDRREAATIPVGDIGGPVLFVTGADDRVVPADTLTTRAMARLDAADYPHRYDHLQVPGAGHDIKLPFHPTTERAVRLMPVPGRPLRLAMGGTAAGYARADARAWERTLETLATGLGSVRSE